MEKTQNELLLTEDGQESAYYYEQWPEINPLNLVVTKKDGTLLKLQTYRYPVPESQKRKGILFYIHGFGGYCERTAYIYKTIAASGYECLAFDQRGFGNSEGQPGIYESTEVIYGDIWAFIFRAIQVLNLNQQETPLFLLGRSFGGAMTYNIINSQLGKKTFRAAILNVPAFAPPNPGLLKYQPIINLVSKVIPRKAVPLSKNDPNSEYYQRYKHYFTDNKVRENMTLSNVSIIFSQMKAAQKSLE